MIHYHLLQLYISSLFIWKCHQYFNKTPNKDRVKNTTQRWNSKGQVSLYPISAATPSTSCHTSRASTCCPVRWSPRFTLRRWDRERRSKSSRMDGQKDLQRAVEFRRCTTRGCSILPFGRPPLSVTYVFIHVVTLIASDQWPKWIEMIETNGGWEIDPNISSIQNQLYNEAMHSEYDINSQHQTSKISADSCWVPPGERTMIHQFRQTWHEHAWQSVDNSIYIYIYLSVKTAYIIKRVCNEVTSPHEIDFNLSNHEVKTSMTSSQPNDMCRDASPSSLIDWWVQQPVGCTDSKKRLNTYSFEERNSSLIFLIPHAFLWT